MGFDPRHWRTPSRGRPITANVDALLAENELLRQEVRALRLALERLCAQASQRVTASATFGPTAERVDRWCQAMARHPSWTALRVGPPGGLRALLEDLRRRWWNPALTLEEELDRRNPGLGTELTAALRGPHSRGRWAVRAAFALYGPRAMEWLSEEPLRVVEELGQRVERLERRQGPGSGQRREADVGTGPEPGRGQEQGRGPGAGASAGEGAAATGAGPGHQGGRRGTRTANHTQGHRQESRRASSARAAGTGTGVRSSGAGAGQDTGKDRGAGASAGSEPAAGPSPDSRRWEALRLLGLEPGATPRAIKRAYWRLAKAHHPDLGGDPQAFHRLDAAYRLLLE
ncbi:MAG: J domain-containing protein [Cyanobacteriota bacterium]|nr:J domain-containing protein [Cyanobacteriota bacterium]